MLQLARRGQKVLVPEHIILILLCCTAGECARLSLCERDISSSRYQAYRATPEPIKEVSQIQVTAAAIKRASAKRHYRETGQFDLTPKPLAEARSPVAGSASR